MQVQSNGIQNHNSQSFGNIVVTSKETAEALVKLAKSDINPGRAVSKTLANINSLFPDTDVFLRVAENGDFRYSLPGEDVNPGTLLFAPASPLKIYTKRFQDLLANKSPLEQFELFCTEATERVGKFKAEKAKQQAAELAEKNFNEQAAKLKAADEFSRNQLSADIFQQYGSAAKTTKKYEPSIASMTRPSVE